MYRSIHGWFQTTHGFPHDNLSSDVDGPIGLVTEVETS